ncbi:MAG: AAA family ATPase [Polyangiales bacterium]
MDDEPTQAQDLGTDDTFEALLKRAAHVSGPALTGLGLRLRPGDVLRDGRLRIERRVGEGGMGVVYEAFDQQRGTRVALKTLSRLDAESVYRLKSEFRSLADVSHANLCRLLELFSGGGDWFFTMELVHGERFDRWVRPHGVLDEARLRAALGELVDGVGAIHAAGKLHRDLKPSNVLVASDGRVVVLDFGLVADHEGGVSQTVADGSVTGTPAYMAPEQARGDAATVASDFYAIGVMLFEALTGRPPFDGRPGEVMARKQHDDAPDPRGLVAHAADLGALCHALLAREPAERPGGDSLRAALVHTVRRAYSSSPSRPPSLREARDKPVLVGREGPLARLRDAYAQAVRGEPVMMLVSGESGMGKSALIAAFLDELSHSGQAVVLAGRCYERESVPFKGFDALVDDVSRYLRKLSREDALAVLPRDVFALARLFPVLERVPVIAEAPTRPIEDPQELRRRAFAAFGELLNRIRDRRPLCLHIDDLQWADADSVPLLRALMIDGDPASALCIFSYRSEGAEQNERLAAIVQVAEANARLTLERIQVEPLAERAAEQLALQSLPSTLAERDTLAQSIAREAGGSPFFVAELARHVARSGELASLSSVLREHIAGLEGAARELLEVSALAGKPLPVSTLLKAASSSHDALDDLRARHLIRLDGKEQVMSLSCYHDRVRETVASQIGEELRVVHYRALAEALLDRPDEADPDLLTVCFEGSRQLPLAAHFAAVAAARAEQGMAFERAAELYRKALALAAPDALDRQAHAVALADALANAGRGKESADAYLAAAENTRGEDAIDLRRKAADELIASGYSSAGEQLARSLCAELGIEVPGSRGAAMLQFMLSQTRIRFSKFGGKLAGAPTPRAEKQRLEMMQSLTRMASINPVLGAWASNQYLLRAEAARDPVHLVRALALHAANTTTFTPANEARIASLYALAHQIAAPLARADLDGNLKAFEGTGMIFGRRMEAARATELLVQGRELLQSTRGVRYELDIANLYALQMLQEELTVEARRAAALVEEALVLGRIWGAAVIAPFSTLPRLAVGDASGVKRHLAITSELWDAHKPEEMQWVEICFAFGRTFWSNYHGEPEQAVRYLAQLWPAFERAPVYRGALAQAAMFACRGVASLATHRRAPRPELLHQARRDRKALEKLGFVIYDFYKLALTTGLALADGDRPRAVRTLRAYLADPPVCPNAGKLDVPAARRRLGQLLGDVEGEALIAHAEADMRARGVVDLERVTEMVLPGCFV